MRDRNAHGSVYRGCLLYIAIASLAVLAAGSLLVWASQASKKSRLPEAVPTPTVAHRSDNSLTAVQSAASIAQIQGPTRRIAILPAFIDSECPSKWRESLNSFDAHVQAELLTNWNVEVLARAGLSTVAFEGKLRAATDAKEPAIRVLPADFVMVSVFDMARHELRVHITPIREPLQLGAPLILTAVSEADLRSRIPAEAARLIAKAARLDKRALGAGPTTTPPPPSGGVLSLALLDPVTVDGRQTSATVAQAPLFRAVLEQVLAAGTVGEVRLLERGETSRLLEEQALQALTAPGAEANAASRIGRIRRADLILLPFAEAPPGRYVEMILFAIEATTGRILDSVSWKSTTGEPPALPPIQAFLIRAAKAAGSPRPAGTSDGIRERHLEAGFLVSLPEQWQGLRMNQATKSQVAIRLADAALGLAADAPEQMENLIAMLLDEALPAPTHPLAAAFSPNDQAEQEIEALRRSGQLAALRASARRIFEQPLQEVGINPTTTRSYLPARFWNRMGEYAKALSNIENAPQRQMAREEAARVALEAARAQMGLGRYEACLSTLSRINKRRDSAIRLGMDAYRALKNEPKELDFLWDHRDSIGWDSDRLTHLLDLAAKLGRGKEALQFFANDSHTWARDELAVQFAVIRTRLAVGQTDLAASDTQCVLLNAQRIGNTEAIREAEGILARLGTKPVARLLPIGGYLKLPSDCVIHLIHDQTVPAAHALATARYLAEFWRCSVLVWPVTFRARQLSFYQPLAQAIAVQDLHRLLMLAHLPPQRAVTCVFLTREKFFVPDGGDAFSAFSPRLEVLSEHYFSKYAARDTRPLPLITAIAASHSSSVIQAVENRLRSDGDIANDYAPLQPDVFCNNGSLTMNRFELGVSPHTAKVASQLTWDEIGAVIDADTADTSAETAPADRALVDELSQQLGSISPTVVTPSKRAE